MILAMPRRPAFEVIFDVLAQSHGGDRDQVPLADSEDGREPVGSLVRETAVGDTRSSVHPAQGAGARTSARRPVPDQRAVLEGTPKPPEKRSFGADQGPGRRPWPIPRTTV